ncbi:hypothetical protein KL905_004802 [Ogataea polymorpha]|nr:hypothetical protein KL937_004806 [Ogataea polymorpha]KAG7915753.1 hypothetical protein KL905_004802 [Ogataea polymorpha]KAG7931924.1 hypothetical protein KL904_004671 [Ogataea polymorpha]
MCSFFNKYAETAIHAKNLIIGMDVGGTSQQPHRTCLTGSRSPSGPFWRRQIAFSQETRSPLSQSAPRTMLSLSTTRSGWRKWRTAGARHHNWGCAPSSWWLRPGLCARRLLAVKWCCCTEYPASASSRARSLRSNGSADKSTRPLSTQPDRLLNSAVQERRHRAFRAGGAGNACENVFVGSHQLDAGSCRSVLA